MCVDPLHSQEWHESSSSQYLNEKEEFINFVLRIIQLKFPSFLERIQQFHQKNMQAILANPQGFANAAKTAVETQGGQIENADKAIDVLVKARSAISSTTSGHTTIVNISPYECTWYTYNDAAPIKLTTQFQSHMGAYCTITVHCAGWGAMGCYKDNKHPQYTVQRDHAYIFDGKNLHTAQSFFGK